MDDPTKPKRLEEAITMVGTCQDMCPEYERYRREMQSNLDRWEMVCQIGDCLKCVLVLTTDTWLCRSWIETESRQRKLITNAR